jgi:hypothetical protein
MRWIKLQAIMVLFVIMLMLGSSFGSGGSAGTVSSGDGTAGSDSNVGGLQAIEGQVLGPDNVPLSKELYDLLLDHNMDDGEGEWKISDQGVLMYDPPSDEEEQRQAIWDDPIWDESIKVNYNPETKNVEKNYDNGKNTDYYNGDYMVLQSGDIYSGNRDSLGKIENFDSVTYIGEVPAVAGGTHITPHIVTSDGKGNVEHHFTLGDKSVSLSQDEYEQYSGYLGMGVSSVSSNSISRTLNFGNPNGERSEFDFSDNSITQTNYDSNNQKYNKRKIIDYGGDIKLTSNNFYNDGNFIESSSTLDYGGDPLNGDHMVPKSDGSGDRLIYENSKPDSPIIGIISESGDAVTIQACSEGNCNLGTPEAKPTEVVKTTGGGSDEEFQRIQEYSGTGEDYKITSEEGHLGNAGFNVEYDSEKGTATRTFRDTNGNIIAVQTGNHDSIKDSNTVDGPNDPPIMAIEVTRDENDNFVYNYATLDPADISDGSVEGDVAESDSSFALSQNQLNEWKEECGEECQKALKCEKDACNSILDAASEATTQYDKERNSELFKNFANSFLTNQKSFSAMSSLFFNAVGAGGFLRELDSWFSRTVLNEQAIVSSICYAATFESPQDMAGDGVAVIENSYGNIQAIAHIFAEVTESETLVCTRNTEEDADEEFSCPDGLYCADDGFCYDDETDERAKGYFYKITWGVGAPADELSTPNVDENGVAVEYNIWLGDHSFYEYNGDEKCPLRLINGEMDGAVITFWDNEDLSNDEVCIKWQGCGTKITTTGGSAGDPFSSTFSGPDEIPDICNKVVVISQQAVSLTNPDGSSIGGGGGSNSEDSITSTDEDLSFNTP